MKTLAHSKTSEKSCVHVQVPNSQVLGADYFFLERTMTRGEEDFERQKSRCSEHKTSEECVLQQSQSRITVRNFQHYITLHWDIAAYDQAMQNIGSQQHHDLSWCKHIFWQASMSM